MTPQFLTANEFFKVKNRPVALFENVWYEDSTLLFHTPCVTDPKTFVNKTRTALEIAQYVATKRDVLYISTERLAGLYTLESERLLFYTPQFESIDDPHDYADLVFEAIEHAIRTTAIRTFVIDRITRIAALSFGRNASVTYLMKRLVALQVKCHLSLLVIADSTTRSAMRTLSALATDELTVLDEKDPEFNMYESVLPPTDDDSDISATSEVAPERLCDDSAASQNHLTRQQRRALERQKAKGQLSQPRIVS